MLRPSYLENLPAPMVSLIDELQNEIIDDLVKRIVKGKYNTPSSEWMIYKANQLRLSSAEVNKIIAKNAKVRERLVKELYTDAVKEALSADAEIYRYAISNGALPASSSAALKSYFRDIALNNTFRTGLSATNGLMSNLTRSMAATANRMLSDALDLAWLEVASGAFTPDEACFKAVQKLSANGLKIVNYASGHQDQVDVAVRRAVRTGINKTCCDMQLELAGDVGCDLVEVTSHFGARPSHAEWQGQIYSLSGKHPKYKDFRSSTGYGSGDGLCGWNCRHSFFPYFEGLSLPASIPDFTDEENLEMYQNQQKQRAYERAVRRSKRELSGLDAARQNTTDPQLKEKLDKEFARKSVTLKRREERLSQFCKDKGLMPDNSRVRVAGFGRSEAQKAVWANKKSSQNSLTSGSGSGTISSGHKMSVKSGAGYPLPDYSLYDISQNENAVLGCKQALIDLGLKQSDIKLDGIKNAEVLAPFVKRLKKIKADTGMDLPPITAMEYVEGETTCIAMYNPYAKTLMISSRFFNSKDYLQDTLNSWVDNNLMPKQAKTINYLAEHEMAHVRIDDDILKSESAYAIWRKRKLSNKNDLDIVEYYADAVAIFRTHTNITDSNILKAIEYLESEGVIICL